MLQGIPVTSVLILRVTFAINHHHLPVNLLHHQLVTSIMRVVVVTTVPMMGIMTYGHILHIGMRRRSGDNLYVTRK
jgi:hypothetical protein